MPVPRIAGSCSDESVTGIPFHVMDPVDGSVVRDRSTLRALDGRRRIGTDLIDVLSLIHGVDLEATGLTDSARPGNYVERQLRRRKQQWDTTDSGQYPEVDEIYRRLAEQRPEPTSRTLLHGDFKLDNVILAPDGSIAAVVDWELATLGDPLSDLGLTLAYWADPADDPPLLPAVTAVDGYLTRREAVDRYVTVNPDTRTEVLAFHIALAHWKIACIAQGVLARSDPAAETQRRMLGDQVRLRAARANRVLDGTW